MQQIKRVVIPVDNSEASRIATEQGVYFAKLLNVGVTIINVDETRQFIVSSLLEDKIKKEKEMLLNEIQVLARENGVDAETKLLSGRPAEEIVKNVKEDDLIVMASRGKKGFNKLMLGSVSEEVLKLAPCSVMIIKPKFSADEAFNYDYKKSEK
jgi:nucleotide-binding universal stress UspA family protein